MQTYTRANNVNAFASTFYFFAGTQNNPKKIKRACKPPHGDTANLTRHYFGRTEARTDNKGLAKVAVQWLIEHLCFVSSVVLADSFVLRNRHLRQAPKRYVQGSLQPANTNGWENLMRHR